MTMQSIGHALMQFSFVTVLAVVLMVGGGNQEHTVTQRLTGSPAGWLVVLGAGILLVVPPLVPHILGWSRRSVYRATVAGVGVLVLVYSGLVSSLAGSGAWDWYNTLTGTVISIVAAVVTGLGLYQLQQREAEASRRTKLVELLRCEVETLLERLTSSPTYQVHLPENQYLKLHATHVTQVVVEEAIRSGLLGPKVTKALFDLTGTIRAHDQQVVFVHQALAQGIQAQRDEDAFQSLLTYLNAELLQFQELIEQKAQLLLAVLENPDS